MYKYERTRMCKHTHLFTHQHILGKDANSWYSLVPSTWRQVLLTGNCCREGGRWTTSPTLQPVLQREIPRLLTQPGAILLYV